MGNVDPLRITVDNEPQTLAPSVVGILDADRDWDGRSISADGIRTRADRRRHLRRRARRRARPLHGSTGAGGASWRDRRRRRTIVVDLTETTFLDSTMLHVLLSARSELRDGRRLLLVTNDATVKRVFEITGTDRLFDFYPSRRAAEQEARPR